MKSLFVLLTFVFSLGAFAHEYCDGDSHCKTGWFSHEYYARGVGGNGTGPRACDLATRRANALFESQFGRMECGLIDGPSDYATGGCQQNAEGKAEVWLHCDPSSGNGTGRSNRPKCALIGGLIAC